MTAFLRSFWLPVCGSVIICLIGAGCSRSSGDTEADGAAGADAGRAAGPPPALVRVATVQAKEISPRRTAVGTVRPVHSSIVASASDGVVDEFPVEQGMFVKEGDVLSQLRMHSTDLALAEQRAVLEERRAQSLEAEKPRPEDVEEAQAKQAAAEALLRNAERRLREQQSLLARGAVTDSTVKDAKDAYDEARQQLLAATAAARRASVGMRDEQKLQAKARLEAQQKHVEWLEAEKEKRITRAPFDGFIVQEHTDRGQWLGKGDPVVLLAGLGKVDIEVQVDQEFVDEIMPGQKVRLKIAGVPQPSSGDGRWEGIVHRIVPRSDWETGSRSFPVVIRVDNRISEINKQPIPLLREGMMAEAEFYGRPVFGTLVPKDSLVRTSRGTFVFALNPPDENGNVSVRQISVETGLSEGAWMQARGELQSGVQVVTEGAERLRPFQTVSLLPDEDEEGASEPTAETAETQIGPPPAKDGPSEATKPTDQKTAEASP